MVAGKEGLYRAIAESFAKEPGIKGDDIMIIGNEKYGFWECGRFSKLSRTFARDVDVWTQKFI